MMRKLLFCGEMFRPIWGVFGLTIFRVFPETDEVPENAKRFLTKRRSNEWTAQVHLRNVLNITMLSTFPAT